MVVRRSTRAIAATSTPRRPSISSVPRSIDRSSRTWLSTAHMSRSKPPKPNWRYTNRWTWGRRVSQPRSSNRPGPVQSGRQDRRGVCDGHEYRHERGPNTLGPRVARPRRDTIVIFLTDNGPAEVRFNSGLRGRKGTVYDGGIHVPCYIRWPARLPSGLVIDRIAAHIDLFPTLLEACGIAGPDGVALDGRSLLPLLKDGAMASRGRIAYSSSSGIAATDPSSIARSRPARRSTSS